VVTAPALPPSTDLTASTFERRFAQQLGTGVSAYAFWKGRIAFYAILRALDVGPGDEVVVPGFTCVVVPNAVRLAGATPIYADIEPGGYNLDPRRAAQLVTPRTRAIVVQHSFGIPAQIDALLDLAARRGLVVIEDCAHSLGGEQEGRRLGTVGDAAFFSFQWSKPMTTGLGGMAVTSKAAIADRLRRAHRETVPPPATAQLRLLVQYHAYARLFSPRLAWRAEDVLRAASRLGLFIGSSSETELEGEFPTDHDWRMGPFQEARGERLLGTVPARNAHADAMAARYDARLEPAGWTTAPRPPGTTLLRYPVRVANKQRLLQEARRARVQVGSWFDSPLHPVALDEHARFDYVVGQCPNAERTARQIVNLPLHPRVSAAEADRTARFVLARAERPAS
jgi:dTDP-4-amino-4,6-dideoxygalactose transaminase